MELDKTKALVAARNEVEQDVRRHVSKLFAIGVRHSDAVELVHEAMHQVLAEAAANAE